MPDDAVSEADYRFLARFLLDRCAMVLEPGKEYLVLSRLTPISKNLDFGSVSLLIGQLRASPSDGLVRQIVEAMVTSETSFFRDIHPFETLKTTVLPQLIRSRSQERRLNIWCAASSSGQEPYTIALILKEHFPQLDNWTINLTATDISQAILERAKEGLYSQLEVNRGLPTPLLLKWFRQEGTAWRLNDQIRQVVTFQQMNLADDWPRMPIWDLVFLRNVMIYFPIEVKRTILSRVSRCVRKDGLLVLGGAETTLNLDTSFERDDMLKAGFFRLKPGP